jgi:hypothetical protein
VRVSEHGRATSALRRRTPQLVLLAAFVATRLLARVAFHLFFDADVARYWQVLDLPLLRNDLVRSLFYLHSQPPLYNLLIGVVLKCVPPAATDAAFTTVYLVLGYLGILGIFALVVELGAPPAWALAAALLQTLSTTWLVYESWLFYTLPTSVLMTWSAVWLARAARGRASAVVAFAAGVAALSWLRATYQPAFVVISLGVLLVAVRAGAPRLSRLAGRASLAAACVTLALPVKNYAIVGSFSSSSWLGMSLAHMTTDRLDEATRAEWVRAGRLSPVVLVQPFSPLADYPAELRAVPPRTPSHPALLVAVKSDGSANLNHAAYLGIARVYRDGALEVMRERPDVYLDRVRRAFRTWLRPPTDYIMTVRQVASIRGWDRLHSRLVLWASLENRRAGPTWVLLPALLLLALAIAWRPASDRRRLLLLVAFPLLAIAWNALVGNLVDVEENNRFRVEVEGLMVALGSWGAIEVARRVLAELQRRSSGS